MVMGEFRSAIRALKSTPGPVAAAILTLALAIGMNAGMVGLVDRALLSPPEQVADPDRVVTLAFERGEGDERARMMTTSYVTYAAVRDQRAGLLGRRGVAAESNHGDHRRRAGPRGRDARVGELLRGAGGEGPPRAVPCSPTTTGRRPRPSWS